jgi:type 1 fimbria pilin
MTDSNEPTALANTAGAGGAQGVALQLVGPDGNKLNMGEESSTVVLLNGTNIIPLGVDYLATSATVTPGLVSATATFNINYN